MPVPAPYEEKLGVHPRVCCPTNIRFNIESGSLIENLSCSPDAICSPSGPLCSTYEAEDYGDEYEEEYEEEYGEEYEEYYGDYDYESEEEQPEPTMADEFCSNPDDTCTTLNKCPDLLDTAKPDIPETCGFDKAQSLLMVCCPAQTVKEAGEDLVQKPRYHKSTLPPIREMILQTMNQVPSKEWLCKEVQRQEQTLRSLEDEGLQVGRARQAWW